MLAVLAQLFHSRTDFRDNRHILAKFPIGQTPIGVETSPLFRGQKLHRKWNSDDYAAEKTIRYLHSYCDCFLPNDLRRSGSVGNGSTTGTKPRQRYGQVRFVSLYGGLVSPMPTTGTIRFS